MSIHPILQIGHPGLRETAEFVQPSRIGSPDIQKLVDDLIETMRHANGSGLAATQIHVPLRVCVMEVNQNPRYPYKPEIPLTVLINPVWEPVGSDTFENYEGCLSVPNLRGVVERYKTISLRYLDRSGDNVTREFFGLAAGTIQHEVDHLEGKAFLDHVQNTDTLCTWDMFQEFHKEEYLNRLAPLLEEERNRRDY